LLDTLAELFTGVLRHRLLTESAIKLPGCVLIEHSSFWVARASRFALEGNPITRSANTPEEIARSAWLLTESAIKLPGCVLIEHSSFSVARASRFALEGNPITRTANTPEEIARSAG
jgi:hypothetical protein